MSQNNPLILAGLPLNELYRIREELTLANRGLIRDQKMMAARFEAVNGAIRQSETTPEDLMVSDHAIVRWLERIDGVDLQSVRDRIRAMAAGRYDPNDDHDVIISQEEKAVIVIRGRNRADKTSQAMVVTVLDIDGPIPEKGQLSVMKGLEVED
jgi:hypothetical protein